MGFLSPKMPSLPPVQPLPEPPSNKLSAEEEKRIQEEGGIERAKQTAPDLAKMYEEYKAGRYKQVGDLGPAELYGTKFRPYGE